MKEKDDQEKQQLKEQIKIRDKKISEIQEKFDELLPVMLGMGQKKRDIPKIVESIDGNEGLKKVIEGRNEIEQRIRKILIAIVVISLILIVRYNLVASGEAKLLPSKLAIIRSPSSGIIKQIEYAEGENIEKGSIIAYIDNGDKISQEESKVKHAESNYIRSKWLYENGAIPREEHEKDKYNYEIALYGYRDIVSRSRIISPVAGVMLTHDVKSRVGIFVEQGEDVCEVGDVNEQVMIVEVPEIYAASIENGQKVSIKFKSSQSNTFKGKVIGIGQKIEEIKKDNYITNNVILVTVMLDSMPKHIKPDMRARVKIIYGKSNLFGIICNYIKRNMFI